MNLKDAIKKLIYGNKATSASFIKYMRTQGAKVGDDVMVYSPTKTLIDMTRPWLIDIGNNVQITEGVTILTHGYDWSVLKGVYGEVLGSSGGGVNRQQCVYWNAFHNPKRCTSWK